MLRAGAAGSTQLPTFSIVIETENLARAGATKLAWCLSSIATQDLSPAGANEVLLISSGDVPDKVLETLRRKYPWITVHQISPSSGYYGAKMEGVGRTSGEIVVFADSDCIYQPCWLRAILTPFAEAPETDIVAGETSLAITGVYSLAMAITYIFPRFSRGEHLAKVRYYYLNNVAMRRDLLLQHPIPTVLPVFRGNCSLHALKVTEAGRTIWQSPQARATHAPPDNPAYFLSRFWSLGADCVGVARLNQSLPERPSSCSRHLDHLRAVLRLWRCKLSESRQRTRTILREQPALLLAFPLAAPIAVCSLALYLGGLTAAYFSRAAAPACDLNAVLSDGDAAPSMQQSSAQLSREAVAQPIHHRPPQQHG